MKAVASREFIAVAFLLLLTPFRLPAPVSEAPPPAAPTAAPSRTSKPKSTPLDVKSPSRRFDGAWRATSTNKKNNGISATHVATLVIKAGTTAEFTHEVTNTLGPGTTWSDMPEGYQSVSPIYGKWADRSNNLRFEGSNLRIYWPGTRLVDWSPKSLPRTALKQAGQPETYLYVLTGDQLIATDGKISATYSRLR
jgi:hypothetical protein